MCDVDVPDERSVMTYVAEFFHKFSSEDKAETGARRVELFAEVMKSIWVARNDFERRMSALLTAMHQTRSVWASATPASSYPEAIAQKDAFAEYKRTSKRTWVRERQELSQLYSNIQTKLRTYSLRSWEPRKGLRLEDLEAAWKQLMAAEVARSRSINARIRDIKEALRKEFARVADGFVARLQRAEQVIGSLSGQLQDQKEVLLRLAKELPGLRAFLTGEIDAANRRCLEAKVDENDYTVFTYDDLEFELETTEDGLRKKLAFIDNQIVSAQHTNITPAKLEEFESTFKHFDKDGSNALSVYEMHSALASLGIVYPDEEVEAIYYQLESQFGALTYEAWLALLVEITKDDVSSADQLREAFRDLAGDKGYVTEQDLKFANLGTETVQFLTEVMPAIQEDEAPEQPQRQKQDTTRKPKFDCKHEDLSPAQASERVETGLKLTLRPRIPGTVVCAAWACAMRGLSMEHGALNMEHRAQRSEVRGCMCIDVISLLQRCARQSVQRKLSVESSVQKNRMGSPFSVRYPCRSQTRIGERRCNGEPPAA